MRALIRRYATKRLAASVDAGTWLFGDSASWDDSVEVLHCGIDLEQFAYKVDARAERQRFGIDNSALVVGHVGRFVPLKNHDFVLDVAVELIRREPTAKFLLVGDGPDRSRIERRAQSLGIGKNVVFAGARSDIALVMKGVMDVFLFPSRGEGLGLVLVEAQAAGLPCVLSDVIPPEADVVSELMVRLPLDKPASDWAERILMLKAPNVSRSDALEAVRRSTFNLQTSSGRLMCVYQVTGDRLEHEAVIRKKTVRKVSGE